ncbi:CPBP family intramembrane glutamic endopeptidase [Paenibacillus roseipurpureus]|uniref:CPBP family intramembrane metalloprotease n=1 Tax=Paenibacillus roseopurpureus TaxID=2918901 RepID=A0AA96LSC6_9BACL|nr:CPBP family intramembrane glutamic endopeptidase [Paenibacillus sp. MBLB1832]WNR45656.1 CPBP family intramembrane metalloprotease [Paenibacillus sp. MBLB1832]
MQKIKPNRILILLALIGLALYAGVTLLYGLSSKEPPAAQNPLITKKQAAESAANFIQNRYALNTPQTYVVYQSKKERSGYLQKEHVLEAYTKQYGEKLPLDYYQVSVKDPHTNRQFEVEINYSNAKIISWHENRSNRQPDSAPMHENKADTLAKAELRQMGFDPEDFIFVEAGATDMTSDQPMTRLYEKQSNPIGQAKLQVQTEFDQNVLTGFHVSFKLPASHLAWLKQQDDSASLMTWISMGFTVLMTLAAIIYAIIHRTYMRFSRGLLLTTIFLVIYITNNVNMYPAFRAMGGDANSDFITWASIIFMSIVTLLLGLSLYICLVAGVGLWHTLGERKWPRWHHALFGQDVYHGMGRGYLLALFILGIQQVLFYLGEVNFDVWSVNDPTDSVLNMVEPRLFPLMAWVAAISEEATFRLLGIILFKKLFRSNFIAVLLPSIIWAASHTQYPIYPVYTRLVEVTVIGIILGYVFLKYGFITAIFVHASMDSILMGLSLFSLGHISDILAGLLYIALPGLVGLGLAWLHEKRRKPPTLGEPPPRLAGL